METAIGFVVFFILIVAFALKSSNTPKQTSRNEPIRSYETIEKTKKIAYSPLKVRSVHDIERIEALPMAKIVRVIDGDTVDVSMNNRIYRIRLDAIDCPEDGQEWGDMATRGLIKMIGGKWVKLEKHGIDPYGRTIATLFIFSVEKGEWINVNERMVMYGHAWVMRIFYNHLPKQRKWKLNDLEKWAKSKRIGLWEKEDPIPPWEWRKSQNGWKNAC